MHILDCWSCMARKTPVRTTRRLLHWVVTMAKKMPSSRFMMYQTERKKAQNRKGWSADRMSYTFDAATSQGIACSSPPGFLAPSRVRRLTPLECERLQGFPDNYTLIPWRGKSAGECPDGPRYRAIGNSMAVTVVRWVGLRILRQLV